MKRFFAFAGLMTAAAISLTNCQPKEIGLDQVPSASKTIYITAGTAADTKTTNDGMHTFWEAADTMNVFCKASGDYVNLGKAKVAEGAGTGSATFEITVPDGNSLPSGAATWYAFFPYQKKMESPDGTTGYTYLGHSKGVTQDGFGSKAHLCGNVCPMYGVAEGNGPTVSLTMKQLTSVVEFNVKNSTGKEIIVNSITLTASEDIVGTYYFNFSGNDVVYTPSGESYVYKSATVNLEDSTLGAGDTGKVYLPIKPYTQEGVFKVVVSFTVEGVATSQTIELTPTGDKAKFVAGKIKPVGIELKAADTSAKTIAQVLAGEVGKTYLVENAIVTIVYHSGYFINDGTGTILVYLGADPTVKPGDKLKVNGATSTYNGMLQFNKPDNVDVVSSGNAVSLPTPSAWTASNLSAGEAVCEYVSLTATVTAVGSPAYKASSATVEGATNTISLYPGFVPEVTVAKDKKYNMTGYIYGFDKGKYYYYIDKAEEVGAGPQVEESSVVFDFKEGLSDITGLEAPAAGEPGMPVTSFSKDGVTVTAYNGFPKGNTPVRIYLSTGATPAYSLRTYEGAALVITAPAGKNITKVSGVGSCTSSLGDGQKSAVVTLTCTGGATVNKMTVTLDNDTVVPGVGGGAAKMNADASSSNTVDIVLGGFSSAPSLSATADGTVVTSASVGSITASGATVTFAMSSNVGDEVRSGSITVKSGDYTGVINVYQAKADFNVSRSEVYLDAKAGKATTLTVKSDKSWTVEISGSGFTVSPDNFDPTDTNSTSVSVTADANNTTDKQLSLGTFTVKRSDNLTKTVTVYQNSAKLAAPVITLNPNGAAGKITATWDAVKNADGYRYNIYEDGTAMATPEETTETSVEFDGLTVGKTYTVYVTAVGDGDPYIDSDEATASVKLTSESVKTVTISGTLTKESDDVYSLTTSDGIKITQRKVSGTTAVNTSYLEVNKLRVYVGHTLEFSGKTIKKIEFTNTASYAGGNGTTVNTGTWTRQENCIWEGESNSIVITNAKGSEDSSNIQFRPTGMKVTFVE